MLEVVIRVKQSRSWLTDFVSNFETTVMVHDCTPFGKEGAQGLIEIDTKAYDANEIINELVSHPDVSGSHIMDSENGKIIISVVAKKWAACSTILNSNCYLRDAKALPGGVIDWCLFTPEVETLRNIMTNLKEAGCQAELLRKRRVKSVDILTNKQDLVVRKALELGYFDNPRRITTRKLAMRLKVAPSTLSEMLRRAGKKMAEFYMRKGQV